MVKKAIETIILSILIITTFAFSGCTDEKFEKKRYDSSDSEVSSIQLDVESMNIQVVQSHDENVHIDYYESESFKFDITSDNGILRIFAENNKTFGDYFGVLPDKEFRTIILSIPSQQMTDISVETSNGDIKLEELTINNSIDLKTSDGNIEFGKLNVGNDLNFTVKNGNISGSLNGGWDDYSISCNIKKGESNIVNKDGGSKTLKVDCNNGNINISFVK